MKLFDGGSTYALVNETQVPDNFTTTGSTLVIEWHLGSDITSIEISAKITAINISNFENATLGGTHYCSAEKPCNQFEGDCDFDSHCNGTNLNCYGCPSELGFPAGTDCCRDLCLEIPYQVGQLGFCTSTCPCEIDEGHCQSDDQCLSGLTCGHHNCKPELGFLHGTNCCYNTTAYCSEFLSGENGNWTIQTPFDNPNEVVKEVECQWYIDGSTNTHFIKSGNGSATCGADVSDWSCCTSSSPCTLGEGDCDYDIDCFNRLACGTDNCGPSFPTGFDCCDFPSVTTANDFVMTMALQTFEVSILQYDRFFCTLLSALMINTFRWHQVLCSYMRAAALTLL